MAKPVVRAAITSLWSPKIDSACVAMERAATWMTAGVSSPAILNMFGSISNRPCDAVNVVASVPVWSAPWSVPAAPASDCISMTSGMPSESSDLISHGIIRITAPSVSRCWNTLTRNRACPGTA